MEKKFEVIRRAYGEHWDNFKNKVGKDGWWSGTETDQSILIGCDLDLETLDNYHPIYCYYKRPKSLQGIENNNGWYSIEEHGLPKEYGNYKILSSDKSIDTKQNYDVEGIKHYHKTHSITHYKPIEKELMPLY